MSAASRFRQVGKDATLAGALLGVAAVGVAAGLAAERYAVNRAKREAEDPFAHEPFGLLSADAEHTVTTERGVDLHVEVVEPHGRDRSKPELTVVFVHGFCLDMGTWHFQRRGLMGLHDPRIRMVLYDQPGHGRSGTAPTDEYDLDQLGDDLATVLDAVVPDGPIVLVGHSMGGMTIMSLAERQPKRFTDRVVGVALMSTSAGRLDDVGLGLPGPLGKARKPLMPVLVTGLKWRPELVEHGRRAGSDLTYLLTRRYGFGTEHPSPSLVSYVERMNAATSMRVIAGYLTTLSQHDRYAALEVFDGIETLIVYGEEDMLTPPDHSLEMAAALPGAELLPVPDAGHVANMEHAELVNEHLTEFLRRAVRSARRPASKRRLRGGGRDVDPGVAAAAERARQERAAQAGGTVLARMRKVLRRKGA
jgi:pimeloyl-ACP methyl ester carboxylesterase